MWSDLVCYHLHQLWHEMITTKTRDYSNPGELLNGTSADYNDLLSVLDVDMIQCWPRTVPLKLLGRQLVNSICQVKLALAASYGKQSLVKPV